MNAGVTQLRKLLNLPVTDVRTHSSTFEREPRIKDDFNASVRSDDDHLADRDRSVQSTGTISSSRSSYDRLNSIGDNKELISRPLSLEDTSGIQSNDWSLETQSDSRSTHPMCLCDELAIASRDCIGTFRNVILKLRIVVKLKVINSLLNKKINSWIELMDWNNVKEEFWKLSLPIWISWFI